MILRHVETLRELGFEATGWTNGKGQMPQWLDHRAPVEVETRFRRDDILVIPEDSPNALRTVAGMPHRAVVFCQNHFSLASHAFASLDKFPLASFPAFIACGRLAALSIARAFPHATIDVVPCFADERVFRPSASRDDIIAYMPRKRDQQALMIRNFFGKFHPRHSGFTWMAIDGLAERAVGQVLGRSKLFLSLSRLEAVGMASLEAMASGCVCAGFTGIGGREFASPANGFWVGEDDCEAAADALAQAADVVKAGGARLGRYQEASRATARQWSYAAFRSALEEVWSRLAPTARRS